jgi:hypothetical protein
VIDLTVPPTGAQPRELVIEVVRDVFDRAMALADPVAQPPKLGPALADAVRLAEAARDGDDAAELDRVLQDVAVATIATLVRVRAALDPRTTGS